MGTEIVFDLVSMKSVNGREGNENLWVFSFILLSCLFVCRKHLLQLTDSRVASVVENQLRYLVYDFYTIPKVTPQSSALSISISAQDTRWLTIKFKLQFYKARKISRLDFGYVLKRVKIFLKQLGCRVAEYKIVEVLLHWWINAELLARTKSQTRKTLFSFNEAKNSFANNICQPCLNFSRFIRTMPAVFANTSFVFCLSPKFDAYDSKISQHRSSKILCALRLIAMLALAPEITPSETSPVLIPAVCCVTKQKEWGKWVCKHEE